VSLCRLLTTLVGILICSLAKSIFDLSDHRHHYKPNNLLREKGGSDSRG